jgi:hypothetical protein
LLSACSVAAPPGPTLAELTANASLLSCSINSALIQQRVVNVSQSVWDVDRFKLFTAGSHQAVLTVVDEPGSGIDFTLDDVFVSSSSPSIKITALSCISNQLCVGFEVVKVSGEETLEIAANVLGVSFNLPIAVTCEAKGEVSRSIVLELPDDAEAAKFDVASDGSFAVVLAHVNSRATRCGNIAYIVPMRSDSLFRSVQPLSSLETRNFQAHVAEDVVISDAKEIFIVVRRLGHRHVVEYDGIIKFDRSGAELTPGIAKVPEATCVDVRGDVLAVGRAHGPPILLSASTLEQLRVLDFPVAGFGGCSSLMFHPSTSKLIMCEAAPPYRFLLHDLASPPQTPLSVVQDIGTPSQVPWIAYTAVGDIVTRIDLNIQLLDGKDCCVKREWTLPDWIAEYADEYNPLDLRVAGRFLYVICYGNDGSVLLVEFE